MEHVVRTNGGNLNVRSGPGLGHRVVSSLRNGARVNVRGSQGVWRELAGGGWAHADFLRPASGAAPGTAPATGPEGRGEGLVLPHYRWPGDPHRKMLADFATGSAELRDAHRRWLREHALMRAQRYSQWIFIRGHASRRGDAAANQRLSERRARAVRDFLIAQGLAPERITGFGGVGEAWSGGPENDNSPEWRSVEVIVSNGVIQGEAPFVITGRSPLSREFHIKYLGGGGGGPGFALGVHGFAIRNPHDYYIRYGLGVAGGSIGAPFSLGNPLPPGRGWVRFTTPTLRTVDSFEGRAYLRQSGVQIGSAGFGFFKLWVPGLIDVDLQTGSGLSATFYEAGGGPFDASTRGPTLGEGWRRL